MKARSPHRPAGTPSTPRASASAGPGTRTGTRARAALLAYATVTFLAGAFIGATAASASPASLRRTLASFAGGAESAGLLYGVVFVPVAEPGDAHLPNRGGDRAPSDTVRSHGNLPLVPASLAKLPTTAFALEELGTDFTMTTRVLATGEQRGDTLRGDLVVVGGGDPFLVSERLWLLAREVRATGLTAVTGRLVIDSSWLPPDTLDPVRTSEREISDRPYAARLSAMAVNFNAGAIRLQPGRQAGDPVTVEADPLPCTYLQIDNRLVTGTPESAEHLAIKLEPDGNGGEIAKIEGTLPARAPARVEYRSVSDPLSFSASLVRAFLAREGIGIAGPTVFEVAPSGARLLVEFPSLQLRELVAKANRYSNNFMADQIALALSKRVSLAARDSTAHPAPADLEARDTLPDAVALGSSSRAASLTGAGRWITARLRETCDAPAEVRQLDGSGLHPGSRLTAETLARLLARTWADLRIGPDFAASLAVPGQDGTLHGRFKDGPLPVMRGKTGTMSEPMASGIAGYLETSRGAIVAFAILMNAPASTGWDLARMKTRQEMWVREFLR
jgi:D-alanyl-D-alanine carboxypeptidase/D-alanyl-D-alanine-endopeptidase (penicillin-binding protein 4)